MQQRRPSDDALLVIETHDHISVGSLSVNADARNRVFGYGIVVERSHWRKGYATEAINLLLEFYFKELGYRKAEVSVYSFNGPSLRFHEHLGFRREGCRREALFSSGSFHDVILFGLLAEEFVRT